MTPIRCSIRWPSETCAPVNPPKANRKAPRACDFALYCERNLIERFFNKLKRFSRHRHPLRQTRQKFPRRRSARLRYHPPQLKTGPSSMWRKRVAGWSDARRIACAITSAPAAAATNGAAVLASAKLTMPQQQNSRLKLCGGVFLPSTRRGTNCPNRPGAELHGIRRDRITCGPSDRRRSLGRGGVDGVGFLVESHRGRMSCA